MHGAHAAALTRGGRFDEALALGRRMRILAPQSADAHAANGGVWMARGDFARAVAEGRRAVVLSPDSAVACVNLCLALRGRGILGEAQNLGERALRLDPTSDIAPFDGPSGAFNTGAPVRVGDRLMASRSETVRSLTGRAALPDVTLVCADTHTRQASLAALERCRARCDVARILFFTDEPVTVPGIEWVPIPKLKGRAAYSRFMLKELFHHIDTPHALVVQWDGFIVDPSRWSDSFLRYDYIGARWPWHRDGLQVGNGGFSLRSRHLLEALQDPRIQNLAVEDVSIGRIYRRLLEDEYGILFAPPAVSDRFAYERLNPAEPTFGFHGLFNVWRHLGPDELASLLATLPPATLAGSDGRELAAALMAAGRGDETEPLRRLAATAPAPSPPLGQTGSPGRTSPLILFVGNRTPRPDEDSGSNDAYNTMKVLRELGCDVVFYAWEHPVREGRYTQALDALGVQSICVPEVADLAAWLRARGRDLSVAILSRVGIADKCLAPLKAHAPQAKTVFNTVDLHFLREQRQAALMNSPERKARADKVRKDELELVASTDVTIVVSSAEAELLGTLVPQARVVQIPIFRDVPGRSAPFHARTGILFIGGFGH